MCRSLGTTAIIFLLSTASSRAGLVATVTPSDAQASVWAAPGESFDVDVNLSVAPESILSAQMRLTASTPGIFTVTGGTYATTWDTLLLPVTGTMNPTSAEFGGLPSTPLTGDDLFITLSLTVAPLAPAGDYLINLTDIVAGLWPSGDELTEVSAGADLEVHVVPDPTAGVLLLAGVAALPRRRSDRRRDTIIVPT
ncbi:MAG: hypothetical protein AMXMBFR13_20600 [Phycisphaerae bacterium]